MFPGKRIRGNLRTLSEGGMPSGGGTALQLVVNQPREKDTHIYITVDNSWSMAGAKMEQVISSVKTIVGKVPNYYRFTFRVFSDDVKVLVTKKKKYLEMDKLEKGLRKMGGMTALYDAWNVTIKQVDHKLFSSDTDNVYILIFTDGGDNSSEHSVNQVTELTRTIVEGHSNTYFTFIQAGRNSKAVTALKNSCAHLERVTTHTVENSAKGIKFAFEKVTNQIQLVFRINMQSEAAQELLRSNNRSRELPVLTGPTHHRHSANSSRSETATTLIPNRRLDELSVRSEDYYHRQQSVSSWVSDSVSFNQTKRINTTPMVPVPTKAQPNPKLSLHPDANSNSSVGGSIDFGRLAKQAAQDAGAHSPCDAFSMRDMRQLLQPHFYDPQGNTPNSVKNNIALNNFYCTQSSLCPSTASDSGRSQGTRASLSTLGINMDGSPRMPVVTNGQGVTDGERELSSTPLAGDWKLKIGNVPSSVRQQEILDIFSKIGACKVFDSGLETDITTWIILSYVEEKCRECAVMQMTEYNLRGNVLTVIRY